MFRQAFLTIQKLTDIDREIIFETYLDSLVKAWISKLHYQSILTIDALFSNEILPQDYNPEPKLGFIYFASCSTFANGNYCNKEQAIESNGNPLVSKGGRVSHSSKSYNQPYMHELHEGILNDNISVSTGIGILFYTSIQSHQCIYNIVHGCGEVLRGAFNALCGRYSPSGVEKFGTFMSIGESTMVVISTVSGQTLIDVKELNIVEQKILKDSDEIVNAGNSIIFIYGHYFKNASCTCLHGHNSVKIIRLKFKFGNTYKLFLQNFNQ